MSSRCPAEYTVCKLSVILIILQIRITKPLKKITCIERTLPAEAAAYMSLVVCPPEKQAIDSFSEDLQYPIPAVALATLLKEHKDKCLFHYHR